MLQEHNRCPACGGLPVIHALGALCGSCNWEGEFSELVAPGETSISADEALLRWRDGLGLRVRTVEVLLKGGHVADKPTPKIEGD